MLNEITKKLEEIGEHVFYGLAMEEELKALDHIWNYTVVARDSLSKGGTSRCDYHRYYKVVLVRENYIPEDYEKEIINKLLEIKGLRLADKEFSYHYGVKNNTNTIVESIEITFCKSEKGSV
ncbi:hypothetical protein [Anaerosacchariphilus polymeriproducens]|uniref:Phage protein n=1 Tax=Anaerosacchariphilus polymeriproducens TaxID=1812858 RepID=A0A371ARL1_9FIRM|nr:hypothetical protein [Anaerosacchariphilus polymeriproducens]RDU22207.1 hypothetical protein DWV06_16920 [Anaerosacchariphilus polymeriproducens]